MAKFRERAFLACQDAAGQLHAGPVISGTDGSVPFPTRCPVTAPTPVAVIHTHPPDDVLLPSDTDCRETRQMGLDLVCVVHQDQLACFPTH